MRRGRQEWLRDTGIMICGLLALVTPVLLWTAWSKPVFWAVLVLGCGAILALTLLVWRSRDDLF